MQSKKYLVEKCVNTLTGHSGALTYFTEAWLEAHAAGASNEEIAEALLEAIKQLLNMRLPPPKRYVIALSLVTGKSEKELDLQGIKTSHYLSNFQKAWQAYQRKHQDSE